MIDVEQIIGSGSAIFGATDLGIWLETVFCLTPTSDLSQDPSESPTPTGEKVAGNC